MLDKKVKTKKTIINTFIYTAAIISVIAAFSHIFFDIVPEEVAEARVAHREVRDERDAIREELVTLFQDYNSSTIGTKELKSQLPPLLKDFEFKEQESLELFQQLNEKKKEHKIFGFDSFIDFFDAIGRNLALLFSSIIILLLTFQQKNRHLKTALNFSSFAFMTTAFFFLVWVFYPEQDLPFWSYIAVMFVCAVLISISVRYLTLWMAYRNPVISQLKHIIRTLLDFITLKVKPNYIPKEKHAKFTKDTLEAMGKGMP